MFLFTLCWNNYVIPALSSSITMETPAKLWVSARCSVWQMLISERSHFREIIRKELKDSHLTDISTPALSHLSLSTFLISLSVMDNLRPIHFCVSIQIRVTLVCRFQRGGVSWRSPTTWTETVMSSSNPRSWSIRSRTPATTRTCTESCWWTRRGQETMKHILDNFLTCSGVNKLRESYLSILSSYNILTKPVTFIVFGQ